MSRNRPRNKLRKNRFYKRKGFWLGLLLLALVLVTVALVLVEKHTRIYRERAATHDLTKVNVVEIPSVILDRNGKEIGRIFVQNRSVIPLDKVPERFIDTLITGEDSRFWKHNGVDPVGMLRAAFANLEDRRQGASTITQQLARGAYNLQEQARQRGESDIDRKLEEIFLAMRLEKRYSKREILEYYLNRIYFGSGFYGIRSAALGYFGKEPVDLTIPECASLVTLIKNPTGRSPLNNPDANLAGRNYVLGRMVEEGRLKAADAARYQAQPLVLNPRPLRRGTSHLYERVADGVSRILQEGELAEGGFKIHTTILKEAQDAAQQALESALARAEAVPGYTHPKRADYRRTADASDKPPEFLQGAVLMIDHDSGEVLAHIGGRDYAQAPFDFVESGKRPLGTAFFPFLYAAGLAAGQSPAALVADEAMDNRSVMVGGREGILGEWGMEVDSPT
ncbi:MAG: transglycosylase domain-containing protein, partial [Akkermansiaceae bacterium]|nr:transglycosylase domain-containing protein [Akkermansiaceae bacterium]